MRKSTHKKILAAGCIASIISLAGIESLPVKATGPNDQEVSLSSVVQSKKTHYERETFIPSNKADRHGKIFWYRCVIADNGNKKIYYKSKRPISKNVNDLLRELKKDEYFFNKEVKSKKEIKEIEDILEFEQKTSSPEFFSEDSNEETQVKTPEEFKNLSKIEKVEVLEKLSSKPPGLNIFKHDSEFNTLLSSRLQNQFKNLFSQSNVDLNKPENKKLYNEYMEYFFNLPKAIERFMEDHEICEIYQKIYNIVK